MIITNNSTIFSYFDRRYYVSYLSVWLSVDALADKHPSTSAFMYVRGNPVMLVDPDGRFSTDFVNSKTGDTKHVDDGVDQIVVVSSRSYNKVDNAWIKQQFKNTWSRNDEYFQIIDNGELVAPNSDLGKIIRTVYSEMSGVGNTSDVDRQVVAESIVNRKECGLYGKSYSDILTKSQFNAIGTDAYKDPYNYIKNIKKNSPYFYKKFKNEINGNWLNSISVAYKAYKNIGSKIGQGVVSYVSRPLKSTYFDNDKNLKNVTHLINGLKGITGVWKRK